MSRLVLYQWTHSAVYTQQAATKTEAHHAAEFPSSAGIHAEFALHLIS
jgi:hypothetical protein